MVEAVGKGAGEGLEPSLRRAGTPPRREFTRLMTITHLLKHPLRLWLVAGAVALASLSGCGVRGPLEPPGGNTAQGDSKSSESADPGQNSAAPKKPHEGFILDPLLR